MFDYEEDKPAKKESATKVIKPLKDFKIRCNEFYYDIKKGEEIEVDKKFLANLKTEKVIN